MVGLKNVIICLQLEPNQTWTLSGSRLINVIINFNLLPQTTNKAKFSLCRHKSGTDCVVWHWSLHTGSQTAIFPPTRQPGQSTSSLTCYARSMMKEKLENSDFNVCKRCIDEIILGSQTGFFFPQKKKRHIWFIPLECFFGLNYIILARAQQTLNADNLTNCAYTIMSHTMVIFILITTRKVIASIVTMFSGTVYWHKSETLSQNFLPKF